MRRAILLAMCAAGRLAAAEYDMALEPETTRINWTLPDVLHTVHGTFKLKRGDIHFDPDTGKAAGEVVVDAASGESGSGARDGRMHRNVLESQKYPEVSFAPDRVEGKLELSGSSSVKVHGAFTIHGAAHEVTVPAEITAHDSRFDVKIRFDVPYVAWGMKDPSTFLLKVGKSVVIDLVATAQVKPLH